MASPIFTMTLKTAKEGFFDRAKVINAVDRVRHKNLSKWGAFVRRSARQSIKKAPKTGRSGKVAYFYNDSAVSIAGNPPFSHTGKLKDFIFFAYDSASRSVVVGPTVLNQVAHRGPRFSMRVKGLVPETLEYGGIISIFEIQRRDGRWVRADLRSPRRIAERPQRWRTIRILARPYMNPAVKRESTNPKLSSIWANSVKAA